MKIYSEKILPENIKIDALQNHFSTTEKSREEFYSAEGIFLYENNVLAQIRITDVPIEQTHIGDNAVLVDRSLIHKSPAYSLTPDHISIPVHTYMFRGDYLTMVIEGKHSGPHYKPNNCYFFPNTNCKNNLEHDELAQEFNKFLSMLN